MVTCPTCAVVLFVDMEGVAHAAGDEPEPSQEPADQGGGFDLGAFQIPTETPSENQQAPQDLGGQLPTFDPPPAVAPVAAPASSDEAPVEDLNMEAFLGYDSSGTAGGDSSQTDPNDPLGISAYANSELSSAKDGSLVVTVTISGIDTKDLRTEIRQALQDSRFGWDASAVMSTIRGGMLRLERISPVKATIVINRIKNLAVQIRWEQSAITELDISESDSAT